MAEQFERERDFTEALAQRAGEVALDFFQSDPETETKGDGSPVSEADVAVDNLLRERVAETFPDDGWLSEETADDLDRLERRRVWIVDPIDGTRAFLNGDRQWTICIALVIDERPVHAVVYAPATREMFSATTGLGAMLNGEHIRCRETADLAGATLYGPRSLPKGDKWKRPWPPVTMRWANSIAYRMVKVAAGDIDAAISITPKSEWDLAAAHLIVQEAGGQAETHRQNTLIYNQRETRREGILAVGDTLYQPLITQMQQLRPQAE